MIDGIADRRAHEVLFRVGVSVSEDRTAGDYRLDV